MRPFLVGCVLGSVGAAVFCTIRFMQRLHAEMIDQRASFQYVGEMSFLREERDRKWAEARFDLHRSKQEPVSDPLSQTRFNELFVDLAGE